MYLIYSLLTAAGMLLLSPYFAVRALLRGKDLSNIPERLGWKYPAELRGQGSQGGSIWIHAVSVGEVLAALPLAKQMKERHPHRRLIVSTTTATGQKLARERMPFADAIFYFPLDWAAPVRSALKTTQASIVIVVETEIWPNLLRECRRAGVPVIFVNGRLSEKSFRGFRRAISYSGGLLQKFLQNILNDATLFLMQSEGDASRLLALGAAKDRVAVAGNLKYDVAEPPSSELSSWFEVELAKNKRAPVIVAGSVMAGEEAAVLQAFAAVEREYPDALLILAPRKPEHFDSAAGIIGESGRKLVRRQDITLNGTAGAALCERGKVFLLDSLGELAGLYRLAAAVFVGGSLVPIGGHNILEPAAFGKVPIHGPSMENFRDMALTFSKAQASICVNNGEELGAAWLGLAGNAERASRMGASARAVVDRNRGATERVVSRIEEIMNASAGKR